MSNTAPLIPDEGQRALCVKLKIARGVSSVHAVSHRNRADDLDHWACVAEFEQYVVVVIAAGIWRIASCTENPVFTQDEDTIHYCGKNGLTKIVPTLDALHTRWFTGRKLEGLDRGKQGHFRHQNRRVFEGVNHTFVYRQGMRKKDIVMVKTNDIFALGKLVAPVPGRSRTRILLPRNLNPVWVRLKAVERVVGRAVVNDDNFILIPRKILVKERMNCLVNFRTRVPGRNHNAKEWRGRRHTN